MRVEDQYLDVLQNIEFGVVRIFHENPELTDFDVETVYAALGQYYRSKQEISPCANQRTELRQKLCESVKTMCDLRLGAAKLGASSEGFVPEIGTINSDEMVLCLKRLQKSVQKWSKREGRQGYLNFIVGFVG